MLGFSILNYFYDYPQILLYIFVAFSIFLILKLENWKIYKTNQKETTKLKKIIIISILFIAIMIRIIMQIYINRKFNIVVDKSILYKFRFFFIFGICSFFEELLIKFIMYENFLKSKLPKFLAIIICCIYFTLLHKTDNYPGYIGIFLYQLITLFMFDIYPNIYVYSVYHWIRNFSIFL